MTHIQLINKIEARRKNLNITIINLSKLAGLGVRTVNRFLAGEDVKLSTVERITNFLGLDFAGNEIIDIETLRENRAKEKAIYIVSLVQDTSALEMQGLGNGDIKNLISDTQEQFLTGEYQKNLWAS